MFRQIVFSLLIIGLFPFQIFASNIYPGMKPGQTIYPVNSEDIRLMKEVVVVNTTEAKAIYLLKNTREKAISVEIGFPFQRYQEPSIRYESGGIVQGDIDESFKIKVDGEEIDKIVKSESKIYDFKYSWFVNFKANETKEIECTYSISWSFDAEEYPVNSSFIYYTSTGSYWKDSIQQVDISIKLDKSISHYLKKGDIQLVLKPEGYKVIDNETVEWHFVNWKPNEDIYIDVVKAVSKNAEVTAPSSMRQVVDYFHSKKIYEGSTRFYTNNDLEKFGSNSDVARFYIKVLRNEIFARHGRYFKSQDLNSLFAITTWYKQNPNYSDDMLNDIERKNIQFILDYEKKKGWR